MKLYGKVFIDGKILLKTGLAIGGDKSSIEIGGIDNNVIKDSKGEPFIPGSSIKGKMRSLLEKSHGKYKLDVDIQQESNTKRLSSSSSKYNYNVESFLSGEKININDKNIKLIKASSCECGRCKICKTFGTSASNKNAEPTRLYVRDSFLNEEIQKQMINREKDFSRLELDYTESKWENTIDRITSMANPRNIERVPAGTGFDFQMVYNVYEKDDVDNIKVVFEALSLLQDDYLGANGSRGYGRIEFIDLLISQKSIEDYKENNAKVLIAKAQKLSEVKLDEIVTQIKEKFKLNDKN